MKKTKPPTGWSPCGRTSDFNQDGFLFFLSQIRGLGPRTIINLLKTAGNLRQIYQLATADADTTNKVLMVIREKLRDQTLVADSYRQFAQIKDNYLTIVDDDYPVLLKNIYDPPLFLFYRGRKKILQSPYLLTMVGSRSLATYHQNMVKQIVNELANTPLVIVSGLAYGIDALSHISALNNKLPTIAVLGSGLSDQDIYPSAHCQLVQDILKEGGLLLSECPSGTAIEWHNFPKRNRLLAGLSKAILVISGAQKSGTLITAKVALDEGREVMALPGNINMSLSWGPNWLIKNGASLVTSAEDILTVYNLNKDIINKEGPVLDNELEKQIYAALRLEPLTAEELSGKINLPLPAIQSALVELELKNLVKTNLYNQMEII